MSASPALRTVESPSLNPDWLRPGALTRLLDPSPAWATGLSWDFQQRNYGHSYREVARAKREGER
jgi:hypothetical protein